MARYSVDPQALSVAADGCRASQAATQEAARLVGSALRTVTGALPAGLVADAASNAATEWANTLRQLDDSAAALSSALQTSAQLYRDCDASVRAALGASA